MSFPHVPVAVLAGGPSAEREVSLASGAAVLEALRAAGLEAFHLDPVDDPSAELRRRGARTAFIALHGAYGEDGTVQRYLEASGIPYTGCGPQAGELAFDKARAQVVLAEKGVRVPAHRVLRRGDGVPTPLGAACVVKPSRAGSSLGVTILPAGEPLGPAVEEALRYSDTVLVEHHIRGRELTVGILGDRTLPIVEIAAARTFYDYQAKYSDQGTRYLCPADLGDAIAERVQAEARRAYQALGCQVMGRVDLILSEAGEPYVLEINTIPGLTGRSLLPKAARAAGIEFPDLCVRILELSMGVRPLMKEAYGKTR